MSFPFWILVGKQILPKAPKVSKVIHLLRVGVGGVRHTRHFCPSHHLGCEAKICRGLWTSTAQLHQPLDLSNRTSERGGCLGRQAKHPGPLMLSSALGFWEGALDRK